MIITWLYTHQVITEASQPEALQISSDQTLELILANKIWIFLNIETELYIVVSIYHLFIHHWYSCNLKCNLQKPVSKSYFV